MCKDERELYQEELLKDDEFIKSEEFKNFLIQKKQQEIGSQLQVTDETDPNSEGLQALATYDPSLESITVDEARQLVKSSGILLVPGWDLASSFIIDQIRWQSEAQLSYETYIGEMIRGCGYDP